MGILQWRVHQTSINHLPFLLNFGNKLPTYIDRVNEKRDEIDNSHFLSEISSKNLVTSCQINVG